MQYVTLKLLYFALACILVGKTLIGCRYRVVLVAPIYRNTRSKELGAWSYLKLKLPFVPYPGLVVHDDYKLESVQWDNQKKEFMCRTIHEIDFHFDDEESYQHLKDAQQKFGWSIREIPSVTRNELEK